MPEVYITWSDGLKVPVKLFDNPVAHYYHGCIKHLRHVDLRFGARENPYESDAQSRQELIELLLDCRLASAEEINPDLLHDQQYLNRLHDIYVSQFSQNPEDATWLKAHDIIHLLEDKNKNNRSHTDVWFDYGPAAGPLIKPFDRSFLEYAQTTTYPGLCFLHQHELGKTPYQYFCDREPADLRRICELAKPWIWLKPVMHIDLDGMVKPKNIDGFNQWFEPFKNDWCQHWNQTGWQPWEMSAIIPIGVVDDVQVLESRFQNLTYPKRITL